MPMWTTAGVGENRSSIWSAHPRVAPLVDPTWPADSFTCSAHLFASAMPAKTSTRERRRFGCTPGLPGGPGTMLDDEASWFRSACLQGARGSAVRPRS